MPKFIGYSFLFERYIFIIDWGYKSDKYLLCVEIGQVGY